MNKKKSYGLVFLFDTPALQTDIKKFQLEKLREITDNIIVCDLSAALNPLIDKSVTAPRMNSDLFEVISFEKCSEIRKFIINHNEGFFYFPMFDDYYAVRYVYYLFFVYRVKYGYINNLNPDVGDQGIPKIEFRINKLRLSHIKKAIYNRVIRRMNKFNPAKLYFYTNELCKEHYFWRGNCRKDITKVVGVHSFDFDRYLSSKSFDVGKYAVYLDIFIPYHPDFLEVDCNIDAKKYFENMNEIFEEIEKRFGCKVLIAAHPRSDYSDKEYSFSKDKIYYGCTTELVKGAEFLIGSWSTTNQMAVMSNKPLVIVCEGEAWNSDYCKNACMSQAAFFGCEIIRDKDDVQKLDLGINVELFEQIRRNYLYVDNAVEPDLWKKITDQVELVISE